MKNVYKQNKKGRMTRNNRKEKDRRDTQYIYIFLKRSRKRGSVCDEVDDAKWTITMPRSLLLII